MNKNQIIRVAVIDSNTILRDMSVKQLINAGMTILFQADNGQRAIERIASDGLPDVWLIEENFDAVNILLAKHPDFKVLISSTNGDEKIVDDMLKAGVSGYILKYSDPDEIVTAVKALSKNGRYFSVGLAKIAQEYFSNK